MKKTIIFLLGFFVLNLFIYYWDQQAKLKAADLLWAAYHGQLIEVKNLLEEGAETDWTLIIDDETKKYHHFQFTLLMAAAASGNEKLIKYLLKKDIPLDTVNNQNWSALHIAIRDGHAEIAAQLVKAGANPDIQTDTQSTPLILALVSDFPSKEQQTALIEYLLNQQANPNLQNKFGADALLYAVTHAKDAELVRILLEHKANVCRQYEGKNLLEWAATDKKILPLLQNAYDEQCKKVN